MSADEVPGLDSDQDEDMLARAMRRRDRLLRKLAQQMTPRQRRAVIKELNRMKR